MAMTDQTTSASVSALDIGKQKHARIVGAVLIALAVLVALVFGAGSDGNAVFRLSRPTDALVLPNLSVPAMQFNYIIAGLLAFLGVRQFLRGGVRWSSLSLGIGLALVVVTFLVWATAGKAFSLTGMLQATMVRAVRSRSAGLPVCCASALRSSTSRSRACCWLAHLPEP